MSIFTIRVRATERGYYGGELYDRGAEFDFRREDLTRWHATRGIVGRHTRISLEDIDYELPHWLELVVGDPCAESTGELSGEAA